MAGTYTTNEQLHAAGLRDAGAAARSEKSTLPAGAHLTLITTLPSLAALEKPWLALEQAAVNAPSVFQSYGWISSWAKTYATEESVTELCVIAGFDQGELVFVLPLMKEKTGPVKVLRWLSEPFGQYGDALIAASQTIKPWFDCAIAFIRRLKDIDVIRLRHVREDSAVADYCKANFVDARLDEKAPFLDLTAYASEESYEARYTSSQRKRRKKIRKELEEMGAVEFKLLPSGPQGDAALTEAIAEKNLWLEERGRQNRALRCPRMLNFLKDLSRIKNTDLAVQISELRAGGRPISWEVGFDFRSTHFAYITSHVNVLTDLSPGRLHMDISQRHCIRQGLKKFDLLVPHDQHKESWSSDFVRTHDYYLPLTSVGHIYGQIFLRTLRPVIRRMYYKSPQWFLRLVKPIFGM